MRNDLVTPLAQPLVPNNRATSGPKTIAGKLRSSQNSLKHGRYSGELQRVMRSSRSLLADFGETLSVAEERSSHLERALEAK